MNYYKQQMLEEEKSLVWLRLDLKSLEWLRSDLNVIEINRLE